LDDGIVAIEEQAIASPAAENEARILACGSDLVARGLIGSDLMASEDQSESKQHQQHDQRMNEGASDGIHQNPLSSQNTAKNDTLISDGRLHMTLDV